MTTWTAAAAAVVVAVVVVAILQAYLCDQNVRLSALALLNPAFAPGARARSTSYVAHIRHAFRQLPGYDVVTLRSASTLERNFHAARRPAYLGKRVTPKLKTNQNE